MPIRTRNKRVNNRDSLINEPPKYLPRMQGPHTGIVYVYIILWERGNPSMPRAALTQKKIFMRPEIGSCSEKCYNNDSSKIYKSPKGISNSARTKKMHAMQQHEKLLNFIAVVVQG